MESMKEILSGYINFRDNAKKSSPFYISGSKPTARVMSQFSKTVDAYAQQIADELPRFNLAEQEAFCELMNSRLAWMRQKHTN